ncbi:recombination regulator RecX [Lactobacillus hominis]|uniref:Regulatory protein RecX n=1 Tax=Lactobacillus hominis DSM 23910 = CRBIP 24.179 TaxID=1423758 RepID=I7IVY1_9LACO|nr:recombination regulator RecX [Lactobacillus hominis]KRM84604.1 recombination regulator RecX [Lactobacillus hominis DSM 23910 = CRBIP 24.179]MCT3347915.1 recombination regulator RecX [Lactobacillus hominis]CCI82233.1 Regulatory protein recX [Lactobacillus hominis DSM 23910 = CRBIP 24.179]
MAVITKVSTQKRKGYFNIFLDNQFAFGVSEKILTEYRLFKGTELTDEQIEEIKQAQADSRATDLAMNFLSYQPRSVYEVLQYLNKHEINPEAQSQAVATLTDLGYLDDKKYSELFIKNNLRVGKDGPNSLKNKLAKKGVDPEIIQNCLAEFDDESWQEAGVRLVHSLIHQQGKLATKEIIRKAKTKLLSHGFSSELADLIVDSLDLTNDDNEQFEALKKQGIKVYKRYRNEDDFTRKQKVKRYLYQHGFSSNEIDTFLNGEIIDLSEIDEY